MKPTAYLVYKLADEPEQIVIWDTVDITVGRFRAQDIVVPDSEVSREHAVLRRQDGSHFVQDRGTGLGTFVNGDRIRVHQLAHGDEIQVGPLRMKFGLTERALRAGGNTRFASELRAGVLPAASTEGNRTMLGFQPQVEEAPAPAAPTRPSGPRALSAEGSLEDLGVSSVDLAEGGGLQELLSDPVPLPGEASLADGGMHPGDDDAAPGLAAEDRPTQPSFEPPADEEPPVETSGKGAARAELIVELEGPAEDLKEMVGAFAGRDVRVGEVRLRIFRRRG